MGKPRIETTRLALRPLAPAAARALAVDRSGAAWEIGASLADDWPQADLLEVLPSQGSCSADDARFGVWVIIERQTNTVIGDVGFFGPPGTDGTVEVGYSVVPARRRQGYVTEAVGAVVAWVLTQPHVTAVVARCGVANEPSIRTLRRIGSVLTTSKDDHLSWQFPVPPRIS